MFIYATKLVWGIYEQNELVNAFICNDDTTLLNQEGNEIELPEEAFIGILHPFQLNAASLQKWKTQLYDLSVEQVFSQLERTIPDLTDINLNQCVVHRYVGKRMVTGSIKTTLEKYGWHKGATGDGGFLESYNLLYVEKQIEVVLELEGVGVGYGWSSEEKLGRLYIINKTKQTNKWMTYIKDESDERLVPLKNIPTIFLNEMFAAIEAIKRA
jgi:hypothetical protein